MRKNFIFIVLVLTILALVPAVSAQDDDICEALTFIEYGDSVTGRITNGENGYFDAYCFEGTEGDEVVIDVEGTSGDLDTLVRLWDNTIETLYEENDDVEEGNTDSQIVFTLPDDGDYLILVSRYELEDGDSTGNFELTLTRAGGSKNTGGGTKGGDDDKNSNVADPSEVITLDCDTGETLYGGLQFGFISINPGFSYTVTVFGIDDFDPVLAVETEFRVGSCNDDERNAAGSFAVVPGEGNLFASTNTAQVRFSMPRAGSPVITVGSFDGQGGQFAMVIEGLAIQPSTELDGFVIRVPEALTDETLSVYMISRYTDLDPHLQIAAGDGLDGVFTSQGEFLPDLIDYNNAFFIASCDDAGSFNCEEGTPALPGGGVDIANGRTYITGSFDAGIQLVPETTEPLLYVFGSSESRSRGEYAILIIGTAPAVDID